MRRRTSLFFVGTVLLVLATAGTVAALNAAYNRPNPTMDYVPQGMGFYDTMYSEYEECTCRVCHGNSTADRHHYTNIVLRDKLCTVCHPTCTPGSPDCDNGILVKRDCMASGCHSWADVGPKDEKGTYDPANVYNGWHHNTDMASAENCTGCHNPNLIEEISDFRDHQLYPPSVVTPTPFSCENCHWEQALVAGTGDCNNPGHPSTYDHVDAWGNDIGFYEYSKPIYGNFDTHHMGFKGDVASDCSKCHSQDPNNPSWNPYNPELMRYCEICHSIQTLHTIAPHVSPHPGWFPVGFHANDNDFDGLIDEDATDSLDNDGDGYVDEDPPGSLGPNPFLYATWDDTSPPGVCAPEQQPGYTADMQCWGCHADAVPPYDDPVTTNPWIDDGVDGMIPIAGSCDIHVTIRGGYFGSSQTVDRRVEIKVASATWIELPVHAWTDNVIEWMLPCWTLAPGNYKVRVHTEAGNSNQRVFTVKDHPTLTGISPASGGCSTVITLTGSGGFGASRKTAPSVADPVNNYYGIYHTVDFVASEGTYTVNNDAFTAWSDTSITLVLNKVFEDQVDTCGEPTDKRNFVRDDGTAVPSGACAGHSCPDEPKVSNCECLGLGVYQVYVKSIYYGDEDGSNTLTCGDIIFQVEKSDPVQFELVQAPFINKAKPNPSERTFTEDCGGGCLIFHKNVVKIIGSNFGPTQEAGDEVRLGSMAQYDDYCSATNLTAGKLQPVKLWSATRIKIKLKAKVEWEGKTKYLWVSKGGQCSNAMPIGILDPISLCSTCP